jgi:hypothetical protein
VYAVKDVIYFKGVASSDSAISLNFDLLRKFLPTLNSYHMVTTQSTGKEEKLAGKEEKIAGKDEKVQPVTANHQTAALHHEHAAKHHKEAVKPIENGDHEKASQSTLKANGHAVHAHEASKEIAKTHAAGK